MDSSFFQREYFDNTIENYLWFTGILLAGFVFKRLFSALLSRLLYFLFRKHGRSIGWERFIKLTNRPFQFLLMLTLVYVAARHLRFPDEWNLASENELGLKMVLQRIFYSMLVFSCFWVVIRMIDFIFLVSIERARTTESKVDDQLLPFMKEAVKVVIGAVGFLAVLSVAFKLDIVGLVTGLGIGGLAFALAAKETLENLLGSFTIFFDKPFSVGNVVKVGNVEGTVEAIGFRSTKIRLSDHTLVTMPNKKMVDAELLNETEREMRRSSFAFQISNETSPEKTTTIVSRIRSMIQQHELIAKAPLQVSFRGITPTGLEIYCNFCVISAEMDVFLTIQQEINLAIINILREEGVSFPTEKQLRELLVTVPAKPVN